MPKLYQPTPANQLAPRIHQTAIPGLLYLEHNKMGDSRGFFSEITLIADLNQVLAKPFDIKQINQARSGLNVTRGFHAENWRKLVWVSHGTAFCALADIRKNSPTFKTVETFMLGEGENCLTGSLFIDRGIANSVCVITPPLDYVYCVDALYRDRDPKEDQAISLFDPELRVDWPISRDAMVISNRDQTAVTLAQKYQE